MSTGIFSLFFPYYVHQTTYENLLKTWLILEIKFDLELAIFKVKGVFGNFFHIRRVKLHRNTLLNLHDKRGKFFTLHFTSPAGLSIYRPAVRSGTLPEISSDFMYKFCIL